MGLQIDFFLGMMVYIVIWFICLFMVLPLGIVTQEENNQVVSGTVKSAPRKVNMKYKVFLTTVVAMVVFLISYFVLSSRIIIG